jgi:hypothetical protein
MSKWRYPWPKRQQKRRRVDLLALVGGTMVLVAHVVYAASWFTTLSSVVSAVFVIECLGWIFASDTE